MKTGSQESPLVCCGVEFDDKGSDLEFCAIGESHNNNVYYMYNKAIRDGKYLALPHSSAWQRSPPIFFRDVISLLARVFIFLIDRATQEVPIQNILEKNCRSQVF